MLCGICSILASCGYHVSSQVPGTLRAEKIWIPFFANETVSSTAQTVLRRAFYDEFHAFRGLTPADSVTSADLVLQAPRLLSYSTKAVSYNAADQIMEYSMAIEVELEVARKNQQTIIWKGRLSGDKTFPANRNLALQRVTEEEALAEVSRVVAHKLISVLEKSY